MQSPGAEAFTTPDAADVQLLPLANAFPLAVLLLVPIGKYPQRCAPQSQRADRSLTWLNNQRQQHQTQQASQKNAQLFEDRVVTLTIRVCSQRPMAEITGL